MNKVKVVYSCWLYVVKGNAAYASQRTFSEQHKISHQTHNYISFVVPILQVLWLDYVNRRAQLFKDHTTWPNFKGDNRCDFKEAKSN